MFEENENPVIDEITENVEQATEELVDGAKVTEPIEPVTEQHQAEEKKGKFYTDEEFNKIIKTRLGRQEDKIRKEYKQKYGDLENVLRAGTGEEDIDKITNAFTTYYETKGIKIPKTPQYSGREIEILANAEADDIISAGYEEIVEEVDRLAEIGADNMTPQDKIIFSKLAKERTRIEDTKELASIGVTELPDDFKEFAKNLNPNLSTKEKYELYKKFNPKKEVKTIGSMKNTDVSNNGVKEYYSFEEASKFTKADFDANPELFKAVCDSMTKWK